MTNTDPEIVEEVRVIIANPELCAEVTSYFTDAGLSAYGDFRDDDEEVLIGDADADRIDYVVFASVWHIFERPNLNRKTDGDLTVKVYVRHEQEVKTMQVGAAINMILERRNK